MRRRVPLCLLGFESPWSTSIATISVIVVGAVVGSVAITEGRGDLKFFVNIGRFKNASSSVMGHGLSLVRPQQPSRSYLR